MTERAPETLPTLFSIVRRNGESVQRVAEWKPGDPELTPDDPRWVDIESDHAPDWQRGIEWKGIGGWPNAKPETLADVADWLRNERAECNEWANIATETAADRLRVRLHNAAQLCTLVSGMEPPVLPQCGDPWQNAKANAHTLLSWLSDQSYDWQAANDAMLKEHELNVQATKPLAEELQAVVRQALSEHQQGGNEPEKQAPPATTEGEAAAMAGSKPRQKTATAKQREDRDDWLLEQWDEGKLNFGELLYLLCDEAPRRGWVPLERETSIGSALRTAYSRRHGKPWTFDGRGKNKRRNNEV